MPTYEYRCKQCGHRFEVWQHMTDDPLTVCPQCEGAIQRVLFPAGVVFKGAGFYSTDARPTPALTDAPKSDGESTKTASDSGKSDGTSAKSDVPAKSESTPAKETTTSSPTSSDAKATTTTKS